MLLKIQTKTIFLLVLSVFVPSFIECADGQTERSQKRIKELGYELERAKLATERIKNQELRYELTASALIRKAITELEADLGKTSDQFQNESARLSFITLNKEKRLAYPSDVRGFGFIKELYEFNPEITPLKTLLLALKKKGMALEEAIDDLKTCLDFAKAYSD